jgi:galactosylceramide sulfotransferase
MLLHHAIFNYQLISPQLYSDAIYVTIVRDPAKTMESYYNYFNMKEEFFGVSFEKFIKNPNFYERKKPKIVFRNIQSFDLGLDVQKFDDFRAISEFIRKLDNIFNLVMLQEFLYESLILLKNLLCWTFEDMVTFEKNARNESYVESLSNSAIDEVYKWNLADSQLYIYFKSRLMQKIREYGNEQMEKDVEKLKNLIKREKLRCEISETAIQTQFDLRVMVFRNVSKVVTPTKKMLNDENCLLMTMTEPPFTEELRKIHRNRLKHEIC